MKLSVFAVLLADRSLDDACKYLKDSGVQAIEIGAGAASPARRTATLPSCSRMTKRSKNSATPSKSRVWKSPLFPPTATRCTPDPAVAKVFHDDYVNTVLLAEKLGVEHRDYFLRLPRRLPRGQDPQLGDLPLAGRFFQHCGVSVERSADSLLEEG